MAFSFSLAGACGGGPAYDASQVLALKAALSEIQARLDGLQIGVDQVATNRIHQMRVETEGLIDKLDRVQRGAFKNGNDLVDEVARSSHQLSAELRELVRESEHSVYLDLNASLANLNNTLDGLPFVDVDPYVASVEPMRVAVKPFDRRVTLHGYFPALKKGHGDVTVAILGQELKATLAAGSKASFEIPDEQLQEESFVPFTVAIAPDANFISRLWKRTQRLEERLYVQRETPYECKVVNLTKNPEWEVEVSASRRFQDDAATQGGAGRPSVSRTLTAQELFTATVDNAAGLYDTATVKIKSPGYSKVGEGAPCDHAQPSQTMTWTPDSVSYQLSAPSVGGHFHEGNCWQENLIIGSVRRCDPPTAKGGGGSHIDIAMSPTFTAHRLRVEPYVENVAGTFPLGRRKTLEQPVAADENWRIRVVCSFRDGTESWDAKPLVLSGMDTEETANGLTARFSDGKLFVSSE